MQKDFSDKIREDVEKGLVPEFGTFAPINSVLELDDDSRFTFTLKPITSDTKAKEVTFAFVNAKTARLATGTKVFSSKAEFEKYLSSLTMEDIDKTIDTFRIKTDR